MNTRKTFLFVSLCLLSVLLLWGCSCTELQQAIGISPTTQPLTADQTFEGLQKDLDILYAGLNLAHSAGAFDKPGQWSLILTQEAQAQSALNLAKAGLDAQAQGTPVDVAKLLNDAAEAIAAFKKAQARS